MEVKNKKLKKFVISNDTSSVHIASAMGMQMWSLKRTLRKGHN